MDNFWQEYESFFHYFGGGTNILRAIFMGYKTILLEKILGKVIDQRLKEKLTDIWNLANDSRSAVQLT